MRTLRHRLAAAVALIVFATVPSAVAFADEPAIRTDRPSPQILPLPKDDESFHFVIFGDRTGGPVEGIKVLAQAVRDTNLLDPDLVMTVGDLVNGYNQTELWMEQMKEFRSTMNDLRMPWFPVAGNHDIFWRRDARNPEPKPPLEHELHYEKHFGPLWYWFEHKKTGFLVLFSDEGHPDGRTRDFNDPEQQRISPRQMDWIAKSLDEMKGLRHIFVFLHHPYWMERYRGSNWSKVHDLLAKNGNVRAVIAGHIHRMTYSGQRDGIDYYSLATTGGSLPGELEGKPYFGFLHHFNVVTVREDGYKMASIPVGGVFDPKHYDSLRQEDGDLIRVLHHRAVSPPIDLDFDGNANVFYELVVENPSSLPLDVTLTGSGGDEWFVVPDHRHSKIEAGQKLAFEFACVRKARSFDGFEAPEFELRFDVLTDGARVGMPPRTLTAKARIVQPRHGWPVEPADRHFVFDGRTATLRIEPELLPVPKGPFTLEAWVKPANDRSASLISNRKSGRGIGLEIGTTPAFIVRAGGEWVSATAKEKLAVDSWTHVAGVYDGDAIALFVNGKRVASAPVKDPIELGDRPLFVGAMPSGQWNVYDYTYPAAFFAGAMDDITLSHSAKYRDDFGPARPLSAEGESVYRLSGSYRFGPFVPADASSDFQATIVGNVKLETEGTKEDK